MSTPIKKQSKQDIETEQKKLEFVKAYDYLFIISPAATETTFSKKCLPGIYDYKDDYTTKQKYMNGESQHHQDRV